MTATLFLQPGQLEAAVGDIPELLLPPSSLYGDRASRYRQLAGEGNSLADYLLFLARLSAWQQDELSQYPDIPGPPEHRLDQCRRDATPPLSPANWGRHPVWQESVRRAVDAVAQQIPAKGQRVLSVFGKSDARWLENQADALLTGQRELLDIAAVPFIAAALQVQWTSLAQSLQVNQIGRVAQPALCPVCGSHPVASIIRTGEQARGLRYLHCALCGSEWHVVRALCSQCGNTEEIGCYGIEGMEQTVQAETCPRCQSYVKILQQNGQAIVDTVADDIATLSLDLLMGERHYRKSCINLFML